MVTVAWSCGRQDKPGRRAGVLPPDFPQDRDSPAGVKGCSANPRTSDRALDTDRPAARGRSFGGEGERGFSSYGRELGFGGRCRNPLLDKGNTMTDEQITAACERHYFQMTERSGWRCLRCAERAEQQIPGQLELVSA